MSTRRAQLQPGTSRKQGIWQCAPLPCTAISSITDYSVTGMDLFDPFNFDFDSLTSDGLLTSPSADMDDIPLEDLFTTDFSRSPLGENNSTFAPLPAASFQNWSGLGHSMNDAVFFDDVLDPNLAADMSQWGWEHTQQLDIPSQELYSPIYPTPSPSTATWSPCTSQLSPATSPTSTLKSVGAFACPDDSCSKSFATQNLLRKHKRKHTKPFVCSVCAKGHAAKKDLHRHMWVRHPEAAEQAGLPSELRQCSVRGCTFEGRQDNLTRHLRTKHRDG